MTLSLHRRSFFLLVLVLAFVLRFAAVLVMRDLHKFPGDQLGPDGVEFNKLGLTLARSHMYALGAASPPTSFRAPGFPIFLAAIYSIFGESYPVQYTALCLIGALTCGLTYATGRELGTETFARAAALLAVIYVPHIYEATVFASENLFSLCLIAGLLAFLRALRTEGVRAWTGLLVAGLFFGWGILTRPFLLVAMPFLAVVLLWHGRKSPSAALARGAVLAMGCLLVVAPWVLRNYRLFGRPVLVATNGGSTFYGGNNDLVLHDRHLWGAWVTTVRLPGRHLIESTPDEASHDAKEWELGRAWVKGHLSAMPLLLLFKFTRFWLPDIGSANQKYVLLQLAAYTPFLALFLVAAVRRLRGPRRGTGWLALDAVMLSCVLTGLIFWGSPRFRDGNAPALMLYAATGLPAISARRLLVAEGAAAEAAASK
jgi:4-amino-4-deoxy-L-arabinose transferase-like glycosyltransferase